MFHGVLLFNCKQKKDLTNIEVKSLNSYTQKYLYQLQITKKLKSPTSNSRYFISLAHRYYFKLNSP